MNEQLEHTVRLLTRAAIEEKTLETKIMYRALLTFGLGEKSKAAICALITDRIESDKAALFLDSINNIHDGDCI